MGNAEKRSGRKFTADQKAKLSLQAFIDANIESIKAMKEDPQKLKICKEILGGIIKEAPNTKPSTE